MGFLVLQGYCFIDYYRIDKRGWLDHKANTQLVKTEMKKMEKECTNICQSNQFLKQVLASKLGPSYLWSGFSGAVGCIEAEVGC